MPSIRSTDGTEIDYRTAGEGPTDLVLMHGWAGSGAYFDDTIEHLDRSRIRAITLDLRGHGKSGRSESGYTLDQITDDVMAVADAAGARRFVLVGFSMSGKFAQYVSSAHPDRVLGQVLVAGCPAVAVPLPPELVADWYGRAGDARRMAELMPPYMTQPVTPERLQRFGEDAAGIPLVALRGTMDLATSTSFAERLADITAPTLVVGGRDDPMFTPDVLEAVAAPLGARLEFLDSGHEVPLEQPARLAALIDAFVAELTATAGRQPVSSPGA